MPAGGLKSAAVGVFTPGAQQMLHVRLWRDSWERGTSTEDPRAARRQPLTTPPPVQLEGLAPGEGLRGTSALPGLTLGDKVPTQETSRFDFA